MIKQSELEVMVCDLFVDAYRAGQSCGDLAYNAARGTRARLIKELGEVYAELEHESYQREQFEVELKNANHKIEGLQRDYDHMCEIKDRLEMTNHSKEETIRKSMFPGCTPDDLPFPDVDDLAPASEVLGGEE